MLAIRLQRTGRSGHAQYRVIVQDARRSPKSGNIVARLGSYNPHTKTTRINKEEAQRFLDNGAQPSDRVVGLLKKEGVKLPKWVNVSTPGKRTTRNPEKLRKNRPAEPEKPAGSKEETKPTDAQEAPKDAAPSSDSKESTPEEPKSEAPAEDKPAETDAKAEDKPAEEPKAADAENKGKDESKKDEPEAKPEDKPVTSKPE